MKTKAIALAAALMLGATALQAQILDRFIEVTGTAELEAVPDRIHYLIEIREYFEEEFDGRSKPEDYRTKVPITQIERNLRQALAQAGVRHDDIRTQEVGDYWRQQGQDFLISKQLDVTLTDPGQIDEILRRIDTRGINTMRIGELESDNLPQLHRQGKIEALKAAQEKADYLLQSIGKKRGNVISITEEQDPLTAPVAQNRVVGTPAGLYEAFRAIRHHYSIRVKFYIVD